MRQDQPWGACAGITLRKAGGASYSPASGPIQNLNVLSTAADDLFHPNRHKTGQQILFNRGCQSDCQYCGFQWQLRRSYPSSRNFWRSREADTIVDEIELYADRHKVTYFHFFATVFFGYDEGGSRVVEQVAQEILRRKLKLRFRFVSHPQQLIRNRSLLPLLKEAGLHSVHLGIDSGSEASLARFRVEFGLQENLQALRTLHTEGVAFTPGFIFYEPWMTLGEIHRQLEFLREIQPFFRHMKQPYPFFLDRHLLHQVLGLQASIPIVESLRREALLTEPTHFWQVPHARFRETDTGEFFRIHQQVYRRLLHPLRLLLWNRACVDAYPRLNLLPIDLLEHSLAVLQQIGPGGEEQVVRKSLDWIRHELWNDLPGLIDTACLGEGRREKIYALFQTETEGVRET